MNKGETFESLVQAALSQLASEFPLRFVFRRWPRLRLRNDQVAIPDFEIEFDLPHLKERFLIECQDRTRNSNGILHKIEHIRAQSGRNKFMFLYHETVTPATLQALRTEGVIVFSYIEFSLFLDKLRISLKSTHPPGSCGGVWEGEGDEEE